MRKLALLLIVTLSLTGCIFPPQPPCPDPAICPVDIPV